MPSPRSSGCKLTLRAVSVIVKSPTRITPWSGCSRPATQFSVVVLPQPDGPRKLTNSPGAMVSDTSSIAFTVPLKIFVRCSMTSPVGAPRGARAAPFVAMYCSLLVAQLHIGDQAADAQDDSDDD